MRHTCVATVLLISMGCGAAQAPSVQSPIIEKTHAHYHVHAADVAHDHSHDHERIGGHTQQHAHAIEAHAK